MSEVYWITGGEIKLPGDNISEELVAAGIRPGWIDEVHWISTQESRLPVFTENLPAYRWNVGAITAHRLLHLLLSDLLTNSREIILLGEICASQVCFSLLGSPQAAGRYNLLPRFRLSDQPLMIEGNWDDRLSRWSQHLEGLLIEPPSIAWISAASLSETVQTGYFPNARLISPAPDAGLLTRLHLLLARLEETRTQAGLLVEEDGMASATLIERI
jgi:hypothetical protein